MFDGVYAHIFDKPHVDDEEQLTDANVFLGVKVCGQYTVPEDLVEQAGPRRAARVGS